VADKLNQHWIPQHHLRLFSNGNRYIHVILRDGSKMALYASIKDQCARRLFYGNIEMENWLGALESRHAALYRRILQFASESRFGSMCSADDLQLRQALLVQRARTPRNAHVSAHSMDQAFLYTYREYLQMEPSTPQRDETIRAIDQGRASLKNSEFMSLMLAIRNACGMVKIIKDLRLLILRNQTSIPFVVGDAPSVLSNPYMSDVKEHGVLGYSTRGLMISMPINSKLQILLFDRAVYRAASYSADCVDVIKDEDVSALNIMQVYAAQACVYFADHAHSGYIKELIAQHPPTPNDHKGGFNVLSRVQQLNKGSEILHTYEPKLPEQPNKGSEILHMYEPQLPVFLYLSFVRVKSRPPGLNLNTPRKPSIVNQMEQSVMGGQKKGSIGIDALVHMVEAGLIIRS